MSADSKEITFLATIPPIQSSLKFGGDVGRVTLEIPKSEVAKAVGLIALQDVVLEIRITTFADKRKRQKKEKPKGEFGRYWQTMCAHGLLNSLELKQILDAPGDVKPEEVKEALRGVLQVTSLTFVSPPEFESWCEQHSLASLITISRNAEAGL